ncbi:MAG TPA: NAD(P)/FAD-dependent oxidoreductase [Candidatus Lokiarchaeia archaeon]|nr:NAD(P)/FAD-dependent oxidoreductase [Candidatus Lokiarchaeia archaeon]
MSHGSESSFFNEEYDVIVVGAGIGGLNCACWLALNGKKVIVLEKNGFLGGRCASYHKQGFKVDYGIHAFSLGEKGPLQEAVRAAKIKLHLKKSPLSWWRYPITLKFNESIFSPSLPINYTHFWNLFRTLWRILVLKETKRSDKFALLKTIYGLLKLRIGNQESLESLNVKEMLEKFSDSAVAQKIIASSSDCVSVIPYNRFIARDFMDIMFDIVKNGGIWYPKGGCGAISQAYSQIIKKCGGSLHTTQEVDEILIKEDQILDSAPHVIGVKLKNSQRVIHASCVVANVHFSELFEKLLKQRYFPESLGKKINSLETSLSALVLHLAFDSVIFSQKIIMDSPMLLDKETSKQIAEGPIGGLFVIASNLDPYLVPQGKQLVIAALGINPVLMHEKDFLTKALLDKLQTFAPPSIRIRDHVEWMDVFGPQEIESLFGEKGAVIGIASTVRQGRKNRLDSRTPVRGLFHCGDDSGVNLWGVGTELAARSGLQCAKIILDEKWGNGA